MEQKEVESLLQGHGGIKKHYQLLKMSATRLMVILEYMPSKRCLIQQFESA